MKKIIIGFLGIVMALMLLTGCRTDTSKRALKSEAYTTDVVLDSFFEVLHKKGMFNGAVAVKKNGALILKKGYGVANLSNSTPFLPHTAMEVASVSKQFTAVAILLLEQDKKLSADDNLQKYLGTDFPYSNITIKHLITHTSGLPDYEPYFRKTWDTTKIAGNTDIVAYFKANKPDLMSLPGKKYHYSNSGYVLLAEIVHAVSGKPLDAFLKERVFDVIGMSDTKFYDRGDLWTLPDYAPGYQMDLSTCLPGKPESQPGKYYYYFLSGRLGPGRLSSTVEDLIKWDTALYGNDLLDDEGKALAFTAYPAEDEDSDYGYGWHVTENADSGKVVYHTGSWAGNQAYIRRYLANKDLLITLNNIYSPYMKQIRTAIEDYLAGKPLMVPKVMGVEALKNAICTLDQSSVVTWCQAHTDYQWKLEDLNKLLSQYQQLKEDHKVESVAFLIDYISTTND